MDRGPTLPTKTQTPSPSPAGEEVVCGSVRLVHAVGMHARPAVKLAKLAKRFKCRIAVRVSGTSDWIDAKSVAKVMTMRAACDSTIEFSAVGADAKAAVGALSALIANDFPDSGR